MQAASVGFLESLYQGTFRADLYAPKPAPVDEEKVARLAAAVREAAKGYEPRVLESQHTVPPELMGRLRGTGIFGLLIPRDYGGLGFTLAEYLRAIELMSASDLSLAIIPLAHLSIGLKGILLYGTEDQKRRYLPCAASGETIFAFALTEPDIGSDAQHVRTAATRAPDGSWLLEGTKTYITNANYAGAFTVFAQTDPANPGRLGAFIVERGWQGVSVGQDMAKMGLSVSSTAAVRLKGVTVPAANVIGEPGDGFRIAMTILNYGRLGLSAASAGLMEQSLVDMRKRASTRVQFGAPIHDFQLIQEKMVNARAHAFAAQAMTWFTTAHLAREPLANAAIESSHCKLYGTTRCWDTLNDALQTAGGSGYLATLPFEKRVRDFRVTTIFEGTTEIHSMYPALTVLRSWAKMLSGRSGAQKLALLAKAGRATGLRRARESTPALRDALEVAARCEGAFRRLAVFALRRFGKEVAREEFLLRRMTSLSLAAFWLVASIAWLKARYPGGTFAPAELDVLAYLTAEAREVLHRDERPEPSERERIHARVFAALKDGGRPPAHSG